MYLNRALTQEEREFIGDEVHSDVVEKITTIISVAISENSSRLDYDVRFASKMVQTALNVFFQNVRVGDITTGKKALNNFILGLSAQQVEELREEHSEAASPKFSTKVKSNREVISSLPTS